MRERGEEKERPMKWYGRKGASIIDTLNSTVISLGPCVQ
jgi:hypothetical protein